MMIDKSATVDAVQDVAERREALDPQRSFIVQAPAGSGKTSLLTQRYLTLLAHVHHPEEIIAITFTRKAATEMRNRIIEALNKACEAPPATEHEHHTWALARAVLARDEHSGWNLLAHPARLRIHTIDALCNTLTRQMPVLSNFGAAPVTTTDMADLYHEAARETLALLETGERWSLAIERLLIHLDNDLALVEAMLANMLEKRDQWLRHVTTGTADRAQQRAVLEKALHHTIKNALVEVRQSLLGHLPVGIAHQLAELMRYAASNPLPDKNCSIRALQYCESLPGDDITDLPAWLGIATLFLTDKGTWRKQADKNIGFPAPDSEKDGNAAFRKDMKNRFKLLLDNLPHHNDGPCAALNDLRHLPSMQYSDDQWLIMEALLDLLPVAVAQLHMVFRDRGQVDFSEVAQRAAHALGSADNPTDLALALDYRIQHILVDEFQDTSFGQYQLLERLIAGWQRGDGRTLFLVGDPMQSIYRFREAEVGLFLRAREYGVGDVKLEPLTLRVNFRSQAGIVDWFNHAFKLIFPLDENISNGAVTYSPSIAAHPTGKDPEIYIHPCFDKNSFAEAAQIATLIEQARNSNPAVKIAILVRARSHLTDIVAALQAAGLRYRAIEIESLEHRPIVQDLLALTRALLNPADRIAWLAVLRAPWCGLTLADLHALCATQHKAALFDVISVTTQFGADQLTIDGQVRLARIHKILGAALAQRRRQHLRHWVEGVWLALGGPACVEDETDLEDAAVFFDLLEKMQRGGDIENIAHLEEQLARLFALPDQEADESLQLMTIHKAKGLEFDTVIVPGLARRMPADEDRLLRWIERPAVPQGGRIAAPREESDLLLAPIKARGQKEDNIYAYLKYVDQQKQRYETARLLYVAITRAKKALHLFGSVTLNEKDGSIKKPLRGSLLSQLWPVVEAEFIKNIPENINTSREGRHDEKTSPAGHAVRRLSAGWCLPEARPHVIIGTVQASVIAMPVDDIEFLWASDKARHIGSAVHRMLRQIARQGVSSWNNISPEMQQRRYRAILLQLGVMAPEVEDAVQRVTTALQCTINDERGRWVVDQQHHDARCEYALSGLIQGKLTSIIIDRTFVDTQGCVSVAGGRMPGATDTQGRAQAKGSVSVARSRMPGATDGQGIRWIIDYKTGSHEGSDINAFLDSEQNRYRGQLERYAALMQQWDKAHTIRLGLYFPLIGGWREWSYS